MIADDFATPILSTADHFATWPITDHFATLILANCQSFWPSFFTKLKVPS
jgi:hypothetical protein